MPVDTSIYQVPAPVSPLQTMANVQGLLTNINQNRLFQQQFAGRQAFGEALGRYTNPVTGETNWGGVMGALSQDPRAAYMLPDISQAQLARQQTELGLATGAQELSNKGYSAAMGVVAPFLGRKDVTHDQVLTALTDAYQRGQMPREVAGQLIASLPQDPAQIPDWVNLHAIQSFDPKTQVDLLRPTPSLQDVGGALVPIVTNRLSGTIEQAGNPLLKTPTPGELLPYTRGMTPAQIADLQLRMAEPRNIATPTGMQPVTLGNLAGYGSPPFQPVPYGAQTAGEETAKGSAEQGLSLQQLGAQVPARRAALGNMLAAVQNFVPGQGSETTLALREAAGRLGLDWNANATSAQEEFKKQAASLILQQSAALHLGTDEGRELMQASIPSTGLSKAGVDLLTRQLQGNEDAIEAQARAWTTYAQTHGSQSFPQFVKDFNEHFDPRVFQFAHMSGSERTDALKGLKTVTERKAFQQKLQYATDQGWIQPEAWSK